MKRSYYHTERNEELKEKERDDMAYFGMFYLHVLCVGLR